MEKRYIIWFSLIVMTILVVMLFYKYQGFKKVYQGEVQHELDQIRHLDNSVLTIDDTRHLPQPVQKYLAYTGVIGKQKVKNVRVVSEGKFRPDQQKGMVPMVSEQYNFFDDPARFYYIRLNMSGLPVVGVHRYKHAKASMIIKIASLIKVADAKGEVMDKAETVTLLNDMCLLAPASLIDKRIQWEMIDPLTVKATFTNKGVVISALIYFNEKGELINFVSDDRCLTTNGEEFRQARWSTPVRDYKDFNGIKLAGYGEAIWNLPEGDYCYGQINIKEVVFNYYSFSKQY